MSFGTTDAQVTYQMSNVRLQASRGRANSLHQSQSTPGTTSSPSPHSPSFQLNPRSSSLQMHRSRCPRLRSRLGFTLVAAGLRLLPEGTHPHV
jgi:hypothetical protein